MPRGAVEAETRGHLRVCALKHRFAVQRIHAPCPVAEMHVEVGAPGGIVGAGFRVIAHQRFTSAGVYGIIKSDHGAVRYISIISECSVATETSVLSVLRRMLIAICKS